MKNYKLLLIACAVVCITIIVVYMLKVIPSATNGQGTASSSVHSTAITTSPVVFSSNDYGFSFALPDNWHGYSFVKDTWQGTSLANGTVTQTGPKLLLRNPKWTEALPYEDIPILVFTVNQWGMYEREDFAVSAAPIPATELGRNNAYVFALPARWDFDYKQGVEEAQAIVASKPLKAFRLP